MAETSHVAATAHGRSPPADNEEKLAKKLESSMTNSSESSTDGSQSADATSKEEERQKVFWQRSWNPLRWQKIPPVPEERGKCGEYRANFFSHLTFQWMAPLMNTGYLRPLQLEDIWKVNPDRAVEPLKQKLNGAFERRLAQQGRYPLFFALYDTFKFEFWLGGICQLFSTLFQVFAPYLTRYLIAFATEAYIAQVNNRPGPHIAEGIGYALGITFMQIFQSLTANQFFYRGFMVGGQARSVLINVIFDKALKLSARAKAGDKANEDPPVIDSQHNRRQRLEAARNVGGDGAGWSNGRITTLMSVDTDRIYTAMGMFHIIWTGPVAIIVTLIVLCVNIGYSALAGYALLILGVPLLTRAIKSLLMRRKAINKVTDQRVSLTQEILQSVRFVKFFSWESSFLDRLANIRKREITAIQVLLSIRNAILCVSMSLPVFASMLAFITYSLTQPSFEPAPIFSSLALFNSLRMPLNLLPLVIGQVSDAWTALNRIQEFLLEEEIKEQIEWDMDMDNAIEIEHGSFTWERVPSAGEESNGRQLKSRTEKQGADSADSSREELEPFKLTDLTVSIKRDELVAVIGTVGSGKTSLLAALAGDMRLTDGKVRLGASRAYCPQYAWIQNTTVRNNIVFGKEYNEEWYNKVVDACALRPDFEVFPAGDKTEIGERGITVSGGQKQRLNIARAIYFDADIVLLDDPLSAVDAHVGRHIMDQAICGLLKGKCRILATHQLHVLSRCDRIIVMDEGRIVEVDTFDNLMRDSEHFKKLMSTTSQERHEEADPDGAGKVKKDASKKAKGGKQAALMQQEERAVDSVGWDVWKAYILASGSFFNFILAVVAILLTNGANIMTSLWLSYWTSNKYPLSRGQYIGVYAGLGGSQALFMFMFSTILSIAGTNASKTMLHRAMTRVLRAPMSFFNTTPLGRITNRFSKDVHVMDNELTDAMRIYGLTITMIISVIVLIIVFYHWFAIALIPLLVLFLIATNYYRASARDMKRFEAVLRSHVFARFGEAINGVASIRAYGLQDYFSRTISETIDDMDGAFFLTFANQRWLSIRLDLVGICMVFVCAILVVTSRFDVSPSISGLVLSYILAIGQMLQFTIRQLAEVENNMNATERLHYYGTQLEEEAPEHLGEVPPSWPDQGRIVFKDVQMRYRAGLPLVLNNISMDIAGGERIGIVGRTGAGKSSIMSALFRITELSDGSITIDGVDISKIGLHDLRSRLAIIPQDPTLFRGTVRSNLDPFNEHTDLELWDALRQASLVGGDEPQGPNPDTSSTSAHEPNNNNTHNANRIHLDSTVDEEGLNFSLGQRQLMALARALVRNSRIIVCDEATSSVDFETDRKIQETMAKGFKGKTVLCIAHRLRTIITYDRICVMDNGRIAEMDTPLALWERSGIFRSMCDRSGIQREDFVGN